MEYRRLGRTNARVSLLGLGSGGASQLGQKQGLGQEEVNALVRRALELGVTMIDTSAEYGRSEELLGVALHGVARESYYLASKFLPVRKGELEPTEALRSSVERSLRRLGTNYLDLLYLHSVTPAHCDEVVERFREPLLEVQRAGLVRGIGVSESFGSDHSHEVLRKVLPLDLFDVVMVGYNLLSPSATLEVLPLAHQRDVGVVIMCAVRGVLLKPDRIRETVREWKREGLLAADAVPDEDPLGFVLGPWADSMTTAAYKFAAAEPTVGSVLTGTSRLAHFEKNARAILDGPLPAEIVQRVKEIFTPVMRSAQY